MSVRILGRIHNENTLRFLMAKRMFFFFLFFFVVVVVVVFR